MHWLHTTFKDYCKSQGMDVLKDDFKFIVKVLNQMPLELHKSIMRDYCKEWCLGMEKGLAPEIKQNLGRKKANLWLLSKVMK